MSILRCLDCRSEYPTDAVIYTCENCDGLLDVVYRELSIDPGQLKERWERRRGESSAIDRSGVWRYRELLPEAEESSIVTLGEGKTPIWEAPRSAQFAGMTRLKFKHLGMNPTGSFKDLGMTTGMTQALRLGATSVVCASTGNTSASMAAYAARAGLKSFVFIPTGQISMGKLAQALDYGASVLQIDGDFDDAMRLVREVSRQSSVYLLNSVNPFRLEGQKTISIEMLQQLEWRLPDRIVVPGGNLGNSSAIAKGLEELRQFGLISKLPKLTIIQAEGANPLYRMWRSGARSLEPVKGAYTLATAIKIGSPVSWPKAVRGLQNCDGEVECVNEQEIADAKAVIGRDGIGCEPASAVTLAGIKKMRADGRIHPDEEIVAILTGHLLKDPDYTINYHRGSLEYSHPLEGTKKLISHFANAVIQVKAEKSAILKALGF